MPFSFHQHNQNLIGVVGTHEANYYQAFSLGGDQLNNTKSEFKFKIEVILLKFHQFFFYFFGFV